MSGFGAFGQTQQPQQPAANPMFGSFGGAPAANTANTGGGFGGFGATQNAGTSAFGAKPAGFGAFGGGGTSAFGGGGTGTSAFGGGGNTGTSAFGATNTGSAFGSTSGGGLFGAKPAGTGFGAFGGASTTPATGPVANGSSDPPYSAYQEKDGSATLTYQAISAMPAYRGTSFEEIRVQDYAQNRKAPTAGATGFGQSAFGAAAQPAAGGIFGAAAQPQQQPSAFGSTTGGFGSTGSAFGGGGAFGAQNNQQQQPATTGFGGFGQTQPQQPASTGFGAFGQSQPAAPATGGGLFGGGSAFGSTANNQAKPAGFNGFGSTATNTGSAFGSGTSAFGQPAQPATGGGLFGANNNTQQQPSTGFGGFGANNQQNQAKPLFGGTTTGTTGFGATSGGGLFGQTQNQQNTTPATGGGLFGGGGNTGGGLFGNNNNNQQQNQPATGGGLFGNTNNNTTSNTGGGGLFGGGGGLFGANNNNQNQNQQQGSAFGGGGGGLFGAKPAQPNQPSGGLFGGNTGGGGLFGNNNNNQQSNTGGGLFGGLGQSTNNQQNQGNSLFGQKPAQPAMGQSTSGGGLFGGGSSLFGNSTNTMTQSQAQPQQTLTASINEPIGANLPIFSMLPPGPRAVDIDPPKKKPSFFVDVPTRTPVPRLQLSYQPAQSKLRGFSSINGSQFGMSLANGRPGALSLSQSPTKSVGPDMFLNGASPQFGSGSRRSVKKLVLDKKIEPQDLFHKTGSPSPSPAPKITFDPALSRAAREREYAEETAGRPLELPAPAKQRTTPRFTAAAADDGVAEGEYWTKPDISVLKHKSHAELSAFPNLVVGRAGYGEIHFLDPVDLTGLTRLTDLLGEVVRFDEKECCVYPDVDDDDKPPLGQGLNVRAEISLLHCWALDKATREPIKDPKHPQVVKHVKKLAAMKDTHFVGFDHAEGKWTFTVDHF
ncbi:nucleoporin autopeptidase-domain-containing protein [Schizophyllum commune]